MPKEDKERDEKELAALLAIFKRFLKSIKDEEAAWNNLEELMFARAAHVIQRACDGFGITVEEALTILQDDGLLNEETNAKRKVLRAAIDNLADFAVAEEYQMASELDFDEEDFDDDDEELDEDEVEEYVKIFKTYNERYAKVENSDIEYAMMVAAGLVAVKENAILTYCTMQDERVRPWHRVYEGYSAPKHSFPAWLVPPIEHMCRCFLIEEDVFDKIQAATIVPPEKIPQLDPTFKECVAFGGRIFSDEHPYFQVDMKHQDRLNDIAYRIKSQFYNA